MQPLPHRLTSLSMHDWGCDTKELHMNEMLAGANLPRTPKHLLSTGALPPSCLVHIPLPIILSASFYQNLTMWLLASLP